MFIGIFAKVSRAKGEPSMAYFDATRIVKVAENPLKQGDEAGCLFWFHDGDVGGALPYETPSYDVGGLIELVIQARLHPAEFRPSVNVGKRKPEDEPGSTGSLHWSAKDREK